MQIVGLLKRWLIYAFQNNFSAISGEKKKQTCFAYVKTKVFISCMTIHNCFVMISTGNTILHFKPLALFCGRTTGFVSDHITSFL